MRQRFEQQMNLRIVAIADIKFTSKSRDELTAGPWNGGIINLPAIFIIVLMSSLLIKGTKESAFVNGIIVAVKIAVVLTFIIPGWQYINNDNYNPYIPDNTGKLGDFGLAVSLGKPL